MIIILIIVVVVVVVVVVVIANMGSQPVIQIDPLTVFSSPT